MRAVSEEDAETELHVHHVFQLHIAQVHLVTDVPVEGDVVTQHVLLAEMGTQCHRLVVVGGHVPEVEFDAPVPPVALGTALDQVVAVEAAEIERFTRVGRAVEAEAGGAAEFVVAGHEIADARLHIEQAFAIHQCESPPAVENTTSMSPSEGAANALPLASARAARRACFFIEDSLFCLSMETFDAKS